MKKEITIVGAGLVGSLLACLLADRGYKIKVFEKRSDPRSANLDSGRSINLALSNRGLKALEMAGMTDKVKDWLIPMHGRLMHSTDGDLTFQPYGKEGQFINSVSRSGLNLVLIEQADKNEHVELFFNQKCLDIDLENSKLTFEDYSTGKAQEVQSEFVFGTDGAFSAVRSTMQRTDRFNYEQSYIPHGYKELSISPNTNGEFQLDKNALHIWPRKSFMLIALPNKDSSFTCTLFLSFEGDTAFENLQTKEQIEAFFAEQFPDIVPLIPDLAEQFMGNPTGSLVTVRCSPWQRNNTVILGDASHAIVPFYGQGMNAGFEDCSVLIELLDANDNDLEKTLPQFQEIRIPDANAIADLALRNFVEMRNSVADPDFLLRKKIEAKINEAYPEKWIPLYSMVTFSHTRYSEALARGNKQYEIMTEIMNQKDLVENWETVDWKKVMNAYI